MNIIQARKIFNTLSTTQICDAATNARVLASTIIPFTNKPKMLGKAFTVKTDGDLLSVIKALELATDLNVIIIDSGHSNLALAGEIFASEAKRKKIAGIVIDGFCRDIESIKKIGLPVYAKGSCPKAGSKENPGKLNIPVTCGGVEISPDDIIIGDENGIVVIQEQELSDIFLLAEEINQKENLALTKINNGTSLAEIFNFAEHYENILAGKESSLKWTL